MCPCMTTKRSGQEGNGPFCYGCKQLLIFSVCQCWFSCSHDKPEAEIKDSRCLDAGQSKLVFVPMSNVSAKECLDCHCEEFDRGVVPCGRK